MSLVGIPVHAETQALESLPAANAVNERAETILARIVIRSVSSPQEKGPGPVSSLLCMHLRAIVQEVIHDREVEDKLAQEKGGRVGSMPTFSIRRKILLSVSNFDNRRRALKQVGSVTARQSPTSSNVASCS